MMQATEAAVRLKDICNLYGDHPAARGANDGEIAAIKQAFVELGVPLPSALIAVYKVTLGIPGILRDRQILYMPIDLREPAAIWLDKLEFQDADFERDGCLHLGEGSEADLVITQDCECATEISFRGKATVIENPRTFEVAFSDYVDKIAAELVQHYGER